MPHPGQNKGNCGHIKAYWDTHPNCLACCRQLTQCSSEQPCYIASFWTDEIWALAAASRSHQSRKAPSYIQGPPPTSSPYTASLLSGAVPTGDVPVSGFSSGPPVSKILGSPVTSVSGLPATSGSGLPASSGLPATSGSGSIMSSSLDTGMPGPVATTVGDHASDKALYSGHHISPHYFGPNSGGLTRLQRQRIAKEMPPPSPTKRDPSPESVRHHHRSRSRSHHHRSRSRSPSTSSESSDSHSRRRRRRRRRRSSSRDSRLSRSHSRDRRHSSRHSHRRRRRHYSPPPGYLEQMDQNTQVMLKLASFLSTANFGNTAPPVNSIETIPSSLGQDEALVACSRAPPPLEGPLSATEPSEIAPSEEGENLEGPEAPPLSFQDACEDVFETIPDFCPRPAPKPSSGPRIGAEKVLLERGAIASKAPAVSLPLSGTVREALDSINESFKEKPEAGWSVPVSLSRQAVPSRSLHPPLSENFGTTKVPALDPDAHRVQLSVPTGSFINTKTLDRWDLRLRHLLGCLSNADIFSTALTQAIEDGASTEVLRRLNYQISQSLLPSIYLSSFNTAELLRCKRDSILDSSKSMLLPSSKDLLRCGPMDSGSIFSGRISEVSATDKDTQIHSSVAKSPRTNFKIPFKRHQIDTPASSGSVTKKQRPSTAKPKPKQAWTHKQNNFRSGQPTYSRSGPSSNRGKSYANKPAMPLETARAAPSPQQQP